MIIYYSKVSTTSGYEYLLGYKEGNPNTSNVIRLMIKEPLIHIPIVFSKEKSEDDIMKEKILENYANYWR